MSVGIASLSAQTTFPLGRAPVEIPRAAASAPVATEDPETARLRADALAKRGHIGEALAVTRRLLCVDPASAQYRQMEAQYLGWLGRTASAGERFRPLAQENPSDAAVAEGLGNTLLWRGNWRDAQAAYSQAIAASGADNLTAHLGFYRALLAAGRATPAYRQAVELDRRTGRQDTELGLFLATIHAAVDNDDAAFPLASRRTSDPDVQLRQVTFQAQRLVARGRKDEGLNLIVGYAEAHPRDFNAQVAAGEVFTTAGQFRDARAFLERAAQTATDRDEPLLGLARLARQQGRSRDSLALHEDIVVRNPESVPGWLGLAEVAQLRGDLNRAWAALDGAQRVAPGSALIARERLKLAFRERDAETFFGVLRDYQRAQPVDAWPELWAQQWADAHGSEVNAAALQALLDPLAPELTGDALRLLRRHTGLSAQEVAARVPVAPGADLQEAAQEKLGKQVRVAAAGIMGVSAGYEFAALSDTSGAGVKLPAWHEGHVGAYWRRPQGMSLSGEYRVFSRFGQPASQLLLGWDTHLTPAWIVGLETGGALHGSYLPRWRVGARTEYLFNERVSANLAVSHLRFTDEPVLQLVPGVTWQWHPEWSSHARLYVTHDAPKGARANTGLAGLVSTTWQFTPLTAVSLSYAQGEENASQLIQGLIGEKNFQSVGLDLKWDLSERLSLQPTYRYESHNLFDLHAVGLHLQLRY